MLSTQFKWHQLDSEKGNPLLPLHEILFSISRKGSFICSIPDRIALVTPVMRNDI